MKKLFLLATLLVCLTSSCSDYEKRAEDAGMMQQVHMQQFKEKKRLDDIKAEKIKKEKAEKIKKEKAEKIKKGRIYVGVVYRKWNIWENVQYLKFLDLSKFVNFLDLSKFGEDGILFECMNYLKRSNFGIINDAQTSIVYLTNKVDGNYTSMFVIQKASMRYPYTYPIEVWEGGVSVRDSKPNIYKIKFMRWFKMDYMREEEQTDTTYYLNRGDFSIQYERFHHHIDDQDFNSYSEKGQCTIKDENFIEILTQLTETANATAEEYRKKEENKREQAKKDNKI